MKKSLRNLNLVSNLSLFSKHEMTNLSVMPRTCVLVNNTIVVTLVSELTIRVMGTVAIDIFSRNLNTNYVYCSVYHLLRTFSRKSSSTALVEASSRLLAWQ